MSLNWVMLGDGPHNFVHLPGERKIYQSPSRTSFTLSASGLNSFDYSSPSGIVHITTQRIVYTPTDPTTSSIESFSVPITHVHDSRVSAPFFGPNVWTAQVQPVAGGGIPSTAAAVQLRLVFRDGGAFDFHSTFVRIKERILESAGTGEDSLNVHLEDLPAYEDSGVAPPLHSVTAEPPPGYEEAQRESVARAALQQKS